MDAYEDRLGKPVQKGAYVSDKGTYFKINHNPQTGWTVTSDLNPGLIDFLTPELAKMLSPVEPEEEIRSLREQAESERRYFKGESLRRKANWLEGVYLNS